MAKWYFGEAARSFELARGPFAAPIGACHTGVRYFEAK
jgi:hypothetical protein